VTLHLLLLAEAFKSTSSGRGLSMRYLNVAYCNGLKLVVGNIFINLAFKYTLKQTIRLSGKLSSVLSKNSRASSRHKEHGADTRLARIEGHVKAIRKMIAEDRNHSDIIQQISAVQAALDGVVEVMVHDLVEHYVRTPTDGKSKNDTATELKKSVSHIL
jgi:CsoR family transcriptional regulator, copper-sensing transcriptional repressor